MRDFTDVNIRTENGFVIMEFSEKMAGERVRVPLPPREAKRIASALNICASMPAGVETINWDIKGE
jgi:hypothetical protein